MELSFNKLSDRIYYLNYDEESDTPILGYIRGDVLSIMVDAGTSPQHVEIFMNELEKAGLEPPLFTVLTHHHWDHTFGLCALDTVSVACKQCAKKLETLSMIDWSESALADAIKKDIIPKFCEGHIKMAYPDLTSIDVLTPDVIFDGEMTIDLGGCNAVLKHIPSSHGNDCLMVYIPEEKIVFIGDGASEGIIGNDFIDDPDELVALQKFMRALDFETCITGHNEPLSKHDLLSDFADRL